MVRWRYYGLLAAGWSSLAARRAHNPKVAGSNPAPATNFPRKFIEKPGASRVFLCPEKMQGFGLVRPALTWIRA